MKYIENYIDDIMDCFPINKISRKMRLDLLTASANDFKKLKDQGLADEEASERVVACIKEPETIATMVPNNHDFSYYCILGLCALLMILITTRITKPDFLQIFLPIRFEFPDIIERYIQYLFISFICYVITIYFYRQIPQKYLNQIEKYAFTFLLVGAVMAASYFAVSLAFVWFNFNGVDPQTISDHTFLKIMKSFVIGIIHPLPSTMIYACINTWCFVASERFYHLKKSPDPYVFQNIYEGLSDEVINNETSEVKINLKSELTKEQSIQESTICTLVEDVLAFYQEEQKATSSISDVPNIIENQPKKSRNKPKKTSFKKKNHQNNKNQVRLVNDLASRQKAAKKRK